MRDSNERVYLRTNHNRMLGRINLLAINTGVCIMSHPVFKANPMRSYVETKDLNKQHLKLLSVKTGKSIKTLKRLKKTHSFLMHSSAYDCYTFTGYTYRIALIIQKSPEAFFESIREHQLLRML